MKEYVLKAIEMLEDGRCHCSIINELASMGASYDERQEAIRVAKETLGIEI